MTAASDCPLCHGWGCSLCQPELRPAPHPAYLAFERAVREAAAEGGPVVARVFCAACGDGGRTLGTVRRHRRWGLFYEARLLHGVERTPELLAIEADLKARLGQQVPPVAVGLSRRLLDFPATIPGPYWRDTEQDAPAAECPVHGFAELDPDDLKAASGGARPGVVSIHR